MIKLFCLCVITLPLILGLSYFSTEDSVSSNSVGTCHWKLLSTESSNSRVVIRYPPSQEEITTYLSLPETKTLANPLLGTSEKARRWGRIKQSSWQLPADHPRQNRSRCVGLAEEAGRDGKPREFYQDIRRHVNEFHVYQASNALIHEKGLLGLDCGYVQPYEGCETHYKFIGKHWQAECRNALANSRIAWKDMFLNPGKHGGTCFKKMESLANATSPPVWRVREKVFMITSGWDNNYYHWIVDSLTRLVRHYDWLQKNPEVLIHIRGFEVMAKTERYIQGGQHMRRRLMNLLQLDPSRFITGPTLAKFVYFPRAIRCNHPLSNALELRLLTHKMIKFAHRHASQGETSEGSGWSSLDLFGEGKPLHRPIAHTSPRIVLQHRHCQSDKACRKAQWREMDDKTFGFFKSAVQEELRPSDLAVFASSNATQQSPSHLLEEIAAYNKGDILIGLHGAGLANIMFMRPGSLVFEIVGNFDGRFTPVCGYHGPLASIFGVHHYLWYFDFKEKTRGLKGLAEIYPLTQAHFQEIAREVAAAWRTLNPAG